METSGDSQASSGNTDNSEDAKKRNSQRFYFFLTWNNYTMEMVEIVLKILKYECDWYIIQEELGDNNTQHLQGTIKLKKRKRLNELFSIHKKIHWECTEKIACSAVYCSRKDKRNGEIWTHGFELPYEIEVEEPYGWQLEVMDIINNPVDKRHIFWFWEPTGNVGKTTLCRYLAVKHKAVIVSGKTGDILHVVSKFMKNKLFIINIPRSTKDYVNYQAMELVKDGIFMSGKYDGNMVVMNIPHLIVFANHEPNYLEMSIDKWIVKQIDVNSYSTSDDKTS